jgi:protein AATF/BFR2
LRKRDVVPLGPRYDGARISRDAATAEDEDDGDDPFSRGFGEEESGEDADRGAESEDGSDEDEDVQDGDESPATDVSDEEEQEDDDEDEEEEEDEDDDEEEDDDDDDEEDDDDDEEEEEADNVQDKTELRKMMAEEQKSVAAGLSQAAHQDAEKGRAVKTQRSTFDSLLNTRIKLQKALIGTNTLTALVSSDSADNNDKDKDDTEDAFRAAETAAYTLWSALNSLRETLESKRVGSKRKRATVTIDSPTEDLWAHMRSQELSAHPHRVSILEKWNTKARGTLAITPKNKLNNTTGSQQSIVDVLQEQLHGDRLVKRARTPRSCAPLQLSQPSSTETSSIYDDADFYGILLQSLLEQRSADSVAASASSNISINAGFQMRREAKTKKQVDTKASKGRKMRYTVHEKLQNFMAPEDRGSWGERQMDELFGSLFGARLGLGEEDVDEEVQEMEEADDDANEEEAGLMLFRS